LQRKHLPGSGFGFRCSPAFGKRCRQEALGHAEAWIGQDGTPGGGCRFLVLRAYEIPDGHCLATCKGKPVYGADPQRTHHLGMVCPLTTNQLLASRRSEVMYGFEPIFSCIGFGCDFSNELF
jgi:hypothetical protein